MNDVSQNVAINKVVIKLKDKTKLKISVMYFRQTLPFIKHAPK